MKHHVKGASKQAEKSTGKTGTQPSSSGASVGNPSLDSHQVGKRSTNSKRVRARTTQPDAGRNPEPIKEPQYRSVIITEQAGQDLKRILNYIHPKAGTDYYPGTEQDYREGLSTLIEQVAQAVFRESPTHIIPDLNAKEGSKTGHLLLMGYWPPAFNLRKETEDEAFAREAISSLQSESFFEHA